VLAGREARAERGAQVAASVAPRAPGQAGAAWVARAEARAAALATEAAAVRSESPVPAVRSECSAPVHQQEARAVAAAQEAPPVASAPVVPGPAAEEERASDDAVR
jgi:hypothetical protein